MRTCTPCRLCCKIFPLPVLDKPADVWCEYACSTGCSVHDQGRPPVCREYDCYWIEHAEMPEQYRPDRIGIVVTESGTVTIGTREIGVLLLNHASAEARDTHEAQALLADVVAKGMIAMVLFGPDLEIVYDRARYQGVSPRDIEVAYRYELSQDADELRRLGAVEDDYRPLTWTEAEALAQRPPGDDGDSPQPQ